MSELAELYAVNLAGAAWRKSSYTANNSNCVEMADLTGAPGVAVRDSKYTEYPATRISRPAWAAFLTAVVEDSLPSR